MSTSAPPLNDLVTKIRAKYPGAYDDMDDASLTKAVLAKYPQYSDLAAPKIQPPMPQMQQSNVGIALGGQNQGVANPQQPAEQFALQNPDQQGKLATAASIGAGGTGLVASGPALVAAGARALTPAVIAAGNWAEANPVLRSILTEVAKKAAGGTALAAGYKYGKKFIESSK